MEGRLVLGLLGRQLPAFDRHVIAGVLREIELRRREQLDERAAKTDRVARPGDSGAGIEVEPEGGRSAARLHAPDPRSLRRHLGGVLGLGLGRLRLQQDDGGKNQHGGTLPGG